MAQNNMIRCSTCSYCNKSFKSYRWDSVGYCTRMKQSVTISDGCTLECKTTNPFANPENNSNINSSRGY